jgi:hypothetical protein
MMSFPSPVNPPRGLLLLAVAGLSLLPAARARAQLVDTSPFLAPGAAAGPNGGPDSATLELRGIMSTPAGTRYCIYDPVRKAGAWVGLNERGNTFMIKSADLAHQAVTVQSEGRTLRLTLRAAKVAALGAAPGAPPVPGVSAPNAAAGPKPSPTDEAARLAAVADAVRARRQMREQAAQGADQGASGAAGQARKQ